MGSGARGAPSRGRSEEALQRHEHDLRRLVSGEQFEHLGFECMEGDGSVHAHGVVPAVESCPRYYNNLRSPATKASGLLHTRRRIDKSFEQIKFTENDGPGWCIA